MQNTLKAVHRSGSGSEHTATWLRDSAGHSAMNGLFVPWNLLQTFVKMDLYNGNLQNLSPTPQINNLLCLMLHYWRDMFSPHQRAISFDTQLTDKMRKRKAISKNNNNLTDGGLSKERWCTQEPSWRRGL